MSEDSRYSGKIKKIMYSPDTTLEQKCQHLCELNKWEFDSFNNTWKQQLLSDGYDKYVIYDNEVYEFVELNELDPYEALIYMTPNTDGTLDFITHYHNGGTCLSEMIEDGLKNFK